MAGGKSKALMKWYCPFDSTETVKNDGKRQPLCELKSIPADFPSVECTYDIWQKRVPLNSSFRKGKKKGADENVLNYETTIWLFDQDSEVVVAEK